MPRRQYTASLAPSLLEAVAGQRNPNPDEKQIAQAEDLLVRLEKNDVAVRLNLLGQPGEHPDFVVAAWVLPYVYALRGDRDWRRTPQLTGSRQVSPLAIQTYKLLEAKQSTITELKHSLGREVTEAAVTRAITELWQQLRIIPVVDAPGHAPRWQLLRQRYQKAIAEGASTSQVTAISVLASIYLQAVIAATMEEVELFLAPLTARSKVREVLRGLVATRQVHTMQLGHAPHFYVAGTLPEFTPAPTIYASATMPASKYFLNPYEPEEEVSEPEPVISVVEPEAVAPRTTENHAHRPATRKPAPTPKSAASRPHFSRPAPHGRDRKPAQSASNGRVARHAKNGHGNHSSASHSSRPAAGPSTRNAKSGTAGTRAVHPVAKTAAKPAHNVVHKRPVAAGAKAGSGKRFEFSASGRPGTKKRG